MTKKEFERIAFELEKVYGIGIIVDLAKEDEEFEEVDTSDYGCYVTFIESLKRRDDFKYDEIVGFCCPECGEPIYYEDWFNDFNGNCCPVCGYEFELD